MSRGSDFELAADLERILDENEARIQEALRPLIPVAYRILQEAQERNGGRIKWPAGIAANKMQIWSTWIVGWCKEHGIAVPGSIKIAGATVEMVAVPITYGLRHYFLCPECSARVEALYWRRLRWACRRCQRLYTVEQLYPPGDVARESQAAMDRLPCLAVPRRKYEIVGKRTRGGDYLEHMCHIVRAIKIARILENVRFTGKEDEQSD